jgi:hypothetical protein
MRSNLLGLSPATGARQSRDNQERKRMSFIRVRASMIFTATVALGLLFAGCGSTSAGGTSTPAPFAHPKQGPTHIFVIMMENHGYGLVTFFKAPGDFALQLYQPLYSKNK